MLGLMVREPRESAAATESLKSTQAKCFQV